MLIFVDSWKRENLNNWTPSNFIFKLNNTININCYVKLLHLSIIRSIYTINEYNNILNIIFSDTTNKNIIIPVQNYEPVDLCNKINELVNYQNFNISYDETKYIFNISCNINFNLDLTKSDLYKLFG